MAASETLDVVSLNLWGDNGPVHARMSDLAGWLRRERPDLVLLQEVEQLDGRGQGDWLAATAGYEHVDAIRARRGAVAGEGLAVLSRHALRPRPPVDLPEAPADGPRAAQQVDVSAPAGTVRVLNTHLAWRLDAAPARTLQARALVEALPADGRSLLVGGDLNDVPGSEPLRVLEAAGLVDCCASTPHPRATFDRANGFLWQQQLAGRRVDHVLTRGYTIVDARVVLDGSEGPVVSDHYGVRLTARRDGGGEHGDQNAN